MQPQAIQDILVASMTAGMPANQSRINPQVQAYPWSFEVFHPALAPMLPYAKQFCTAVLNHESPEYWLSFLGASGIGKTHLLRQVTKLLRDEAYFGRWKIKTVSGQRTPQIAHITAASLRDYNAPRDYAEFDFVYIEDIGSGQSGDKGAGAVTSSRVAELLQLRGRKWTVLDANMLRDEIADKLDPRIASRLKRDGGLMVEISNPDVPDYSDIIR